MSVLGTISSGDLAASLMESSGHSQRPDESFWKDVFDQAKSTHFGEASNLATQSAEALDEKAPASYALEKAASEASSQVAIDTYLAEHSESDGMGMTTPFNRRDIAQQATLMAPICSFSTTAKVANDSVAGSDAVQPELASQSDRTKAGIPFQPVNVVAVLDESGERKLFIRGKLTDKQAMEVAAHDAAPQGSYSQIHLNGRPIYGGRTEAVPSAFNEFSC